MFQLQKSSVSMAEEKVEKVQTKHVLLVPCESRVFSLNRFLGHCRP